MRYFEPDGFDNWSDTIEGWIHQQDHVLGTKVAIERIVDTAQEAEMIDLPVGQFAAAQIAEHLEVISFFLFNLVKFAERNSRPLRPPRRIWVKKATLS